MKNYSLDEWAEQRGYRALQVRADLLLSVRKKMETLKASGALDDDFKKEYLSDFKYLEGTTVKEPKSIVLIAVPRPAHVLAFDIKGKKIDTILPPTYVKYRRLFEEVAADFKKSVAGEGHDIEILSTPLKQASAQAGLIRYGRNNIGYVPRLGSYVQLVGLVTDLTQGSSEPAPAEVCDHEQQILEDCRNCKACAKACPLGAIGQDRFLLRAEKCYTTHSESERPLPAGIRSPSADCLIGCLACQLICPANKNLLKYENAQVPFTRQETDAMLEGTDMSGSIWRSINEKFSTLGLTESPPLFARNLRHMLM